MHRGFMPFHHNFTDRNSILSAQPLCSFLNSAQSRRLLLIKPPKLPSWWQVFPTLHPRYLSASMRHSATIPLCIASRYLQKWYACMRNIAEVDDRSIKLLLLLLSPLPILPPLYCPHSRNQTPHVPCLEVVAISEAWCFRKGAQLWSMMS